MGMTLTDIKDLLRVIAESGVDEVEVEQEGTRIVVRRQGTTFTVQQTPPALPAPFPYYAPPAAPYGPTGGYAMGGFTPPPHPFNVAMPSDPTAIALPAAPPTAPAAPAAAASAPAAPAAPAAKGQTVKAPIVGTFYRSPSPEAAAFVEVGDRVAKGQVVCIIEAMKLMNEVESDVAGTLRQILAENAQPVEYDQPLFVVEPD